MSEEIPVFEIERFAIHDGEGIRTVIFVQGCPLRCPWCANPESHKIGTRVMRFQDKCVGCGRCVPACERGAVTLQNGRAEINREKCVSCGKCAEKCLNGAIKLSGKKMSASEIFDVVIRDKVYYDQSGGGATFSGGEALAQIHRLLPLMERLKDSGVNIAVETCGNIPAENVNKAAKFTDTFLFDIKTLDGEKFSKFTGGDPNVVLSAFKAAAGSGKEVVIRVPVIPEFNFSREEITEIFVFAKKNGVKKIELLPYHTLGVSKYRQLGLSYDFPVRKSLDKEALSEFPKLGAEMGLEVKI